MVCTDCTLIMGQRRFCIIDAGVQRLRYKRLEGKVPRRWIGGVLAGFPLQGLAKVQNPRPQTLRARRDPGGEGVPRRQHRW